MSIQCNYCGESKNGVRICTGCKMVFYCNKVKIYICFSHFNSHSFLYFILYLKTCQLNDWPNHKKVCRMYQAVKLYNDDEAKKKEYEKKRRLEDAKTIEEMFKLRTGDRPPSLFGIPYNVAVAWGSVFITGIPDFIVYCCACIDCTDYSDEGLFRLSASKTSVDRFVDIFNKGEDFPSFKEVNDINIVAGIIKKFIRELPETPFNNLKPADDSPRALIDAMPRIQRLFVQLIFYIFHKVALNKDKTKMGYNNLMIVTPTFIPTTYDPKYYRAFVEDYDSIFIPEELPFPGGWPHIF